MTLRQAQGRLCAAAKSGTSPSTAGCRRPTRLNETLAGLRQHFDKLSAPLDHPRIQALTDKLAAQAPDLLTFLEALAQPLADWQTRTAQHFPDPQWAAFFQTTVARLWRLEHAVRAQHLLGNGHRQYTQALAEARQWVVEFVADDPTAHALAQDLLNLLERVVRTSSAAENLVLSLPKQSTASCDLS